VAPARRSEQEPAAALLAQRSAQVAAGRPAAPAAVSAQRSGLAGFVQPVALAVVALAVVARVAEALQRAAAALGHPAHAWEPS